MNEAPKAFVLVADLGNYELKFWDGSQARAIRAIRFQLPNGRRPLEGKPNSPVIEHQGKIWHWGVKAYEYRKQYHTVEGDKSSEALLAMMACCDFPAKEFRLSVRTSHPAPEKVANNLKAQLQGCHIFSRNGNRCIAHVEDVTVEPEGLGAWRYAKKQGLIPNQGYTVVIDIGGGTWLSRLFNPSGDIIDQSVDERGGGYDLATSISFDSRLINAIGSRPQPGVIMDGFANGSHYYAHMPQASWQQWMGEHLDPWFKGIISTVKAQYQPYRSRIVRFILTGGSSMLIADKVRAVSSFTMVPDPRFANVLGQMDGERKIIEAA